MKGSIISYFSFYKKHIDLVDWVLRVKTDVDGNLDKYKARVVSKGYRQMEGMDYDENFTPTVRFECESFGESGSLHGAGARGLRRLGGMAGCGG